MLRVARGLAFLQLISIIYCNNPLGYSFAAAQQQDKKVFQELGGQNKYNIYIIFLSRITSTL
jgi:hypothetical protein